MDQVSPFLSGQVASLLTTDPGRRPTAEQLLLRLNGERDDASGRSKPQHQRRVKQDDNDDDDDSDYDTLVQTNSELSFIPVGRPRPEPRPVQTMHKPNKPRGKLRYKVDRILVKITLFCNPNISSDSL